MKTLACCYTRFSTDQQNQSSTIGQLKSIRAYCEKNNIELIDTYIDEAQSGTNIYRKNFQKMISDAPTALWDTVVVYNMSRLSRSVKDTLEIKEYFKKIGKKIISVIDQQEETPEGDFFSLITYGMNELFVKQFKRDSWRGLMVNANECKVQGGVPLFGYRVGKDKKYEIEEEDAKIVKLIFTMIVDGYSYREIAKYLNEKGYTNRGKPFSHNFTDMLRNEKYNGVYVWNLRECKMKLGKKTNRVLKPREEVIRIEGGMPKIIDDETFKKVQEILDKRKRHYKQRATKSKYLLSSILVCGKCGKSVSGESHWINNGKYYRYDYRCNGTRAAVNKCNLKDINMNYLDRYVLDLIKKVILDNKNAVLYKGFINDFQEKKRRVINKQIKEFEKQKESLNSKFIEYSNSLPFAQDEDYIELTKNIALNINERTKIEKELAILKEELIISTDITKEKICSILKEEKRKFKETRKSIVENIIHKIILLDDEIQCYLDLSYLFQMIDGNQRLLICITEKRENVAYEYNYTKIDFTEEKLKVSFERKLNS